MPEVVSPDLSEEEWKRRNWKKQKISKEKKRGKQKSTLKVTDRSSRAMIVEVEGSDFSSPPLLTFRLSSFELRLKERSLADIRTRKLFFIKKLTRSNGGERNRRKACTFKKG